MSAQPQHDYHLVPLSPWPIVIAFLLLLTAIGAVMFMHGHFAGDFLLPAGLLAVVFCMYRWWCDVVHEARVDKAHKPVVQKGLRLGMVLFILSEIMFFVAFFWAFFKTSLDPTPALEGVWATGHAIWPPQGIETFDPFDLPLMNTLLLLLSGCSVTWAHHALLENNQKDLIRGLFWTVILGITFTCCQAIEYSHAPFGFTQGIYASTFFMATGFHGFHVIVGTIFLLVCLIRARKGHFTPESHLGFEFAAWYWHFVDVVWLFLFVFVYVVGK
jgi:cytochrome c oxidase subunit 3